MKLSRIFTITAGTMVLAASSRLLAQTGATTLLKTGFAPVNGLFCSARRRRFHRRSFVVQ